MVEKVDAAGEKVLDAAGKPVMTTYNFEVKKCIARIRAAGGVCARAAPRRARRRAADWPARPCR